MNSAKSQRNFKLQVLVQLQSNRMHEYIFCSKTSRPYESKVLGVIVDPPLSWNENSDKICKKITLSIGAIRRLRNFVDKDTLLSVYFPLVYFSTL